METEEKDATRRSGTVNFERRRYPRIEVDLPIEYARSDLYVKKGRAINASEGGLLIYFAEKMEIGQHLELKLFYPSEGDLNTIEALVEVVWLLDIHLGNGEKYGCGVNIIDISPKERTKLTKLLGRFLSPGEDES